MSWQAWRSMVHHEDIERVEARLRATLAGAPYAGVEFRIWRTDGELRWLQSFAQVQRDDQGNPVQMVGINQDITERKLAEQTPRSQRKSLPSGVCLQRCGDHVYRF